MKKAVRKKKKDFMQNRKTFKGFLNAYGLTIAVILAAITFAGVCSLGAYTYQNNIKSVVSTKDASDALFSSNQLLQMLNGATNFSTKLFTVEKPEEGSADAQVITRIRIYNYSQDNMTTYNKSDINYQLEVTLLDVYGKKLSLTEDAKLVIGETEIDLKKIKLGDQTFDGTTSLTMDSSKLTANQSSSDSYTLQFPKEYVGLISFQVTATPLEDTDWSASGNRYLGRILAYSFSGNTQANWTGQFSTNDLQGVGGDTQKLSGFNYEIAGSGTGTITLTWDTAYVEFSPLSLDNLNAELSKAELDEAAVSGETDSSVKTIQFSVGHTGQESRYTFQFYRTQAAPEGESQGDDGAITANGTSYVNMTFTADAETENDEETPSETDTNTEITADNNTETGSDTKVTTD
jgi:hypothetical protein